MKKNILIKSLSLVGLTSISIGCAVSAIIHKGSFCKTSAASLPTTIDLIDCTNDEIKSYYSSLSSLSESELSGTNLLKNLKGIISKNVTYFSYDQVGKAYLITDRDWKNSPASAMSGYDSSENKIKSLSYSSEEENNPYLHLLYCDYSVQEKTRYKGDGDVSTTQVTFDKEHVWSQSHGFNNGGDVVTGAGTDLHHLKAGTQYGNRTLHNNYSYGFVKENDGDWKDKTYETKNKRGEPLFKTSSDEQNRVFEPQDSDKGDIARALLYMVACYNNLDGSVPTQSKPALELKNYVVSDSSTGFSSDKLSNGYYGKLSDLLAWHRMDPVDEFEIHRNNLIYKNYQHNRNPFIDYPSWVDYIWGTSVYDANSKTLNYDNKSTGHVDLDKDEIYGYDGNSGGVTPDNNGNNEKQESKIPMIFVYIGIGAVVIIVVVLLLAGVITISKKGKVKVKKSAVKKVVKTTTSSSGTKKKTTSKKTTKK